MSSFFSLLPLALDAGTPQEDERIDVRSPRIEPASLPEARLEPSKSPTRSQAAVLFHGLLLAAIILGLGAWDYFTPPAAYVAPTAHDSACPAPQ